MRIKICKNNKQYLPFIIALVLWIPAFILSKFAIYGEIQSILLNTFFLALFSLSTMIALNLFKSKQIVIHKKKYKKMSCIMVIKIIKITAVIATFGILLLIIDRVFIKGIDYTEGLRSARYQWLNSTVSSSILGKAGNLFVPFSYTSLYFTYLNWESIHSKWKYFSGIIGFAIPFIHAALNGGRSNLLLLLIFMLTVSLIRYLRGKSLTPKVKNKKIIFIILFICIVVYVLGIFNSSADLGSVSQKQYLATLFTSLGGQVDLTNYKEIGESLLSLFVYLYHGTWISGSYLTNLLTMRHGFYTSSLFSEVINIFGLQNLKYDSVMWDGAFLHVPGAFFHDFGVLGVLFVAIIFGFLFGYFINRLLYNRAISIIELILILFVFCFIFLSPMVYIFGLTYFKFILFAFLITGIILKIRYGCLDYGGISND